MTLGASERRGELGPLAGGPYIAIYVALRACVSRRRLLGRRLGLGSLLCFFGGGGGDGVVGAPSDEALRALVLLAVDDAPGVVDGEVILVVQAFSGVDGGNDVDSSEDSWSRFVLCFLLGLELLCFPWDGFYICVDGLVGGGFSFRLGRSALPRPDVDCLELFVLSSEACAMRSAAQGRWQGGCERLRSLTADAILSRISCGFPMRGVGFFI